MTLEEWARVNVGSEECDYGLPYYVEAIEDFIDTLRADGWRIVKLHGRGQVSGGNAPTYTLCEVTDELR